MVGVNVAVFGVVGVWLGVADGVQVEKTVGVKEAVLVGVLGVAVRLGVTVWVENCVGEGEDAVVAVEKSVAVGSVPSDFEARTRTRPTQ